VGPNDIVVNRWDVNHLLWTVAWWHPRLEHPHERRDMDACIGRLVAAMLTSADPLDGYATGVNRERMDALMRWLVDEGHMTPVAVRQINAVLDVEEAEEAESQGSDT
jgi:hypothetical protein